MTCHALVFSGAIDAVAVRAGAYRGSGQDAGGRGDGLLRAKGPAKNGRVLGEESECVWYGNSMIAVLMRLPWFL